MMAPHIIVDVSLRAGMDIRTAAQVKIKLSDEAWPPIFETRSGSRNTCIVL